MQIVTTSDGINIHYELTGDSSTQLARQIAEQPRFNILE